VSATSATSSPKVLSARAGSISLRSRCRRIAREILKRLLHRCKVTPSDRERKSYDRRMARRPGEVRLTDPGALRALAHPARLTVVDELYQGGSAPRASSRR
jgi:hypothetical protein